MAGEALIWAEEEEVREERRRDKEGCAKMESGGEEDGMFEC